MSGEDRMLYASRQEIEAYQLGRLKETLERARHAQFFANRLAKCKVASLADLAKLPPTTKEDLREASPWGAVAVPPNELFQYHESFGTTGAADSSWRMKMELEQ